MSKGYYELEDNDINTNNNNSNIIYEWVQSYNNKFLEIYIKYINEGNKKLVIKNEYYKIAIEKENFNWFIILFDNDSRNINDILYNILNLFNYDSNGFFTRKKYDNFINYLNDINKPFKEMEFYYNGKFGNEDKHKYSFINENKFNSIKLQIKSFIESFINSLHKIIHILMENTEMDKFKFEKYVKENKSILKNIKNKKFDILIYAIEHSASKEIIEYIINNYSYKKFNYGIKIKNVKI